MCLRRITLRRAGAVRGLRQLSNQNALVRLPLPPSLHCNLVGFVQNTCMSTLRDLKGFGEPGAVVYLADCVELMRLMPASCVDVVFADPPYRLSGGGITVKSGRIASVDKGKWDRSLGNFEKDHEWNLRWLREARRVLKPDGTLWVTGTHHIIFSLGFALQTLDFKIINNLIWHKPNATPNALHTAFTHAHETLI